MIAAGACLLAAPAAGVASDTTLLAAAGGPLSAVEAEMSGGVGASGAQDAYEAARDLQELVRRAEPVSASCRPLLVALTRYGRGRVLQLEGIDRPSPGDEASGRRAAEDARADIASARRSCRPRAATGRPNLPVSPSAGEVFYGTVVAKAPPGALYAQLSDGATRGPKARVRNGRARFDVRSWAPGRHDLRLVFYTRTEILGRSASKGAWLLPASAQKATPGSQADGALSGRIARTLQGGPTYRAAWIQDLGSGRVASLNGSAPFPAASLVKLGLAAEVISRQGGAPERSDYAYDLRAIGAWSSNLAANRLMRNFGASAAQSGLRRLGARISTYPGEYIIGTELQPALPGSRGGSGPPSSSSRVTSAEDMARMLYAIHASAVSADARSETGLTTHQARLLVGYLLSSQQRLDNASLFPNATAAVPAAQKNGWLNDARHGAAILYGADGPVITVLLTYDDNGVGLGTSQLLGNRLTALVGLRRATRAG